MSTGSPLPPRPAPAQATIVLGALAVGFALVAQLPIAMGLLDPDPSFEAGHAIGLLTVNTLLGVATVLGAALLPARLRALALLPGALVAATMLAAAMTLGGHAWDLVATLLVVAGAWWSGRAALRLLGAAALQGVAIVELVVGFGALGLVVLLLGRLHALEWWSAGAIALACGTLGAWSGARRIWSRRAGIAAAVAGTPIGTACAGLLLLQLGWAIVWLSAPEIQFDALYGKAYLPQLWAATGAIEPLLTHPQLNVSGLAQFVAVPGHLLGAPDTGRWLQLIAVVVLVATTWWLAGSRSAAGPLAALLVAVVPQVVWQASTAYDDLVLSLGAVALAIAVLRTACAGRVPEAADWGTALALGLVVGACVWLKLNMLVLIAGLAAGWVLLAGPLRGAARRLIGVGVGTLAVAGPVLVLRWIDTGNPVFPTYNTFFKSSHYPPVNERFDFPYWHGAGLRQALATPYHAVVDPAIINPGTPPGMYGALIAAVVVAALVGWRHAERRGAAIVWLALVASLIAWWVQFRYLRYLLPSAMIAVTLVAVQLRGWRPGRASAALALVIAGAASALFLPSTVASFWNVPHRDLPLGAAFGRWDEQNYLSVVFPEKAILDAYERLAPPGADAIADAHERTFVDGRDLSAPWEVARLLELSGPPPRTADEALRRLRGLGIGWAVLNPAWNTAGLYPWLGRVLADDGRVVASANGWNLYRLSR